MKTTDVIVTLERIKVLADECIGALSTKSKMEVRSSRQRDAARASGSSDVDFDKPVRPFVKAYAKGLSGPKKFTLLVSWLAKGDLKKEVPLREIQEHWNRMKSKALLGMKFNRFFPAQAKENDWVEQRKKGHYGLRPSWRAIFKGQE